MDESPYHIASAALSACWARFMNRESTQSERLNLILSIAEKLSAEEFRDPNPIRKSPEPRRVMTIFDRIGAEPHGSGSPRSYFPLEPLSASKSAIFPVPEASSEKDAAARQRLIAEVDAAVQNSQNDDDSFTETILAALRQNAWCLPAPGHPEPRDVSLYDHARITAAIAVCLAALDDAELKGLDAALTADVAPDLPLLSEPAGLLVGGDVSGIHKVLKRKCPCGH